MSDSKLGKNSHLVLIGALAAGFVLGTLSGGLDSGMRSGTSRLSILVIGGGGAGLGYSATWLAQKLKCRSGTFVMLSAVLAGLLGAYSFAAASLVVPFKYQLPGSLDFSTLFKNPGLLWSIIS